MLKVFASVFSSIQVNLNHLDDLQRISQEVQVAETPTQYVLFGNSVTFRPHKCPQSGCEIRGTQSSKEIVNIHRTGRPRLCKHDVRGMM